jgi:hypothetical protein
VMICDERLHFVYSKSYIRNIDIFGMTLSPK